MFDPISVRNLVHRQLGLTGTAFKDVPAKNGCTHSPTVLYVYRTFSPPGKEPVVVGITVTTRGDSVDIIGDICKEVSGQVFYRTAVASMPGKDRALLPSVRRIAEDLSRRAPELRQALDA